MVKPNFLTERLSKSVLIDGKDYEINTDFRIGIRLEETIRNPDLSDQEKIIKMLQEYYPVIPGNLQEAIEKALWFYQCGNTEEPTEEEKNKRRYGGNSQKNKICYSFIQDAPYIYTAFLEQYNIDLSEVGYLHWWKFCTMFESLNESVQMSKIMYYRQAKTTGLSRERRQFINEMKKKYKLKDTSSSRERITLIKRNHNWRAYVEQRFKEVEASKNL
jgi:hypothetical protein